MISDKRDSKALHELGNLLAVIAGQAEYLLHQEPGAAADRTPEALTVIRDAALRGRDTLREVYALTRSREAERVPTAAAPAAEGVRVLLIDDDEDVREPLAGLLRHAGHHVETSGDAVAAIARTKVERFECVLTDFTMPGLSGLAVSRIIKNTSPEVFVILMTGADGPAWGGQFREAGVDRLLLKPCGREEILAAVAATPRPVSTTP